MSDPNEFEWVDSLKVVDLKKELRSRRESMTGRKAELAQRLKDRLKHDSEMEAEEQKKEEQKAAGEDTTPLERTDDGGEEDPEEEKEQHPDEDKEKPKVETDESHKAETEGKMTEKSEKNVTDAAKGSQKSKGPGADEKKEAEGEDAAPPAKSNPSEKPADAEPEIDDILGEDDMDDMAFNSLEPAPGKRRKSQTSQKAANQEKAQEEQVAVDEGEDRSKEPAEGDAKEDDDGKMDIEEPEQGAGTVPTQDDVKMAEGTEEKHASEAKKRKLDDDSQPPVDGSASSGSHEAAPKRKRVPIPVPHTKPLTEAKPAAQEPPHPPAPIAKVGSQPIQAPASEPSGPPMPQSVSRALRINNFVRPFNDKSCRDMLEQHGEIVDMWMPIIKTHCYVLYKTEEQAMKAYKATYNLEWPRGGRKLIPHVVTVLEAQREIDRGRMRGGNPGGGSGELQGVSNAGYARANSGQLGTGFDARMDRGPGSGQPAYPQAVRRAVSRPVTLEDLFIKTHTKPSLYYLPLTDEEVMAKKRQEVKAAMRVEDGRGENNGGIRHEPREGYRNRGPPPQHMSDEKRIRSR